MASSLVECVPSIYLLFSYGMSLIFNHTVVYGDKTRFKLLLRYCHNV